jgi:hypothetical protein
MSKEKTSGFPNSKTKIGKGKMVSIILSNLDCSFAKRLFAQRQVRINKIKENFRLSIYYKNIKSAKKLLAPDLDDFASQ